MTPAEFAADIVRQFLLGGLAGVALVRLYVWQHQRRNHDHHR